MKPQILVFLLLLAAVCYADSKNQNYTMSDANGIIRDVVIGLPETVGTQLVAQALVIANLPDARVHLLSHHGDANPAYTELKYILSEFNAKNEIFVYDLQDTIERRIKWTRDPWIRRIEVKDGNYFATHLRTVRRVYEGKEVQEFEEIAEKLTNNNHNITYPFLVLSKEQPEYFSLRGGNVIITDRHVIVGDQEIKIQGMAMDDFKSYLEGFFQKEVIVAGDVQGLFGHIDLRVLYLGNDRLAVGSTRMALDILYNSQGSIEDWQKYLMDYYGFSPRPHMNKYGILASARMGHERFGKKLDDLAQQLEAFGYEIYRVPYIPNLFESEGLMFNASHSTDPLFSYTNGLVMIDEDKSDGISFDPVLLMPTLGFEPLDTAAREVFEKQGFEVREILAPDWSVLVGLVGCITNDLTRIPNPPPDQVQQPPLITREQVHQQLSRLQNQASHSSWSASLSRLLLRFFEFIRHIPVKIAAKV